MRQISDRLGRQKLELGLSWSAYRKIFLACGLGSLEGKAETGVYGPHEIL